MEIDHGTFLPQTDYGGSEYFIYLYAISKI